MLVFAGLGSKQANAAMGKGTLRHWLKAVSHVRSDGIEEDPLQ
jgi:hypothetical protein